MIKYSAILTVKAALEAAKKSPYALRYAPKEVFTEAVALEAAKNEPDALRYVLNLELFIKVAKKLNIQTDQD